MIRKSVLVLFVVLCGAMLQYGCTPVCSNIPTESPAQVRVINALPDVASMLVYVDGRLFDSAYYDIEKKYESSLQSDAQHVFGYRTTYLSDKSPLVVGQHRIVAINQLSSRDTILDTSMVLSDRRQTLLYGGRHSVSNPSIQHAMKMLYLDDNSRAADPDNTLIRFVHVAADLDGIDVYFSQYAKLDAGGHAKPDISINFGEISDQNGGGTGTGHLGTDYLKVPTEHNDGILITAKGDTSNVILLVTYAINIKDLFNTVIVRGESKPLAQDPIVSALALEDGSETQGTFNYSSSAFGVRLINATGDIPKLSMFFRGIQDTGPRNNKPLNKYVLDIQSYSVSRYLPLTQTYDGQSDYFLSPLSSVDTASLKFIFYDSSNSFPIDHRFSFVAYKRSPAGGRDTAHYSALILQDSMSQPADKSFGRVRFVNVANPGTTLSFNWQSKQYTLPQTGIDYGDAKAGPQTITVSDGAKSGQVTFNVVSAAPVTIFFMPATGSDPFPYTVAQNQ